MAQLRRVAQYESTSTIELGKGFSSKVYKGIDTNTGLPVVFKVVDASKINNNSFMQNLLKCEMRTLQLLDHPSVLATYTIQRTPKQIIMVIQYCQMGDLMHDVLEKGAYQQSQALDVLTKIASGVNYIHSFGILHRDLKTSNILLKKDGSVKITDFGFCEFVKERNPNRRPINVGSPLYMSPQAYKNSQYTTKSEAWALGVIFYQMLIGKTPFKGLNYDAMVINVQNGRLINALECSDYSKNILFGLLSVDVNKRWDTTKLLQELNQCKSNQFCCLTSFNTSNFSKESQKSGCLF